ncbi:hypothetical protein [Streptomyces johnsoniae]|uniref:PH domain-containing protein n=1 Tax=Streptomyces johnsoniae TaxID=3075532 RepID=A0ABU2S008_9ACTN|nr:hypothetical protein [Streptomyces sp. DSM 41886]MDT0442346.1 hypothetical protein [Streptomyces sp. DSM 41886]
MFGNDEEEFEAWLDLAQEADCAAEEVNHGVAVLENLTPVVQMATKLGLDKSIVFQRIIARTGDCCLPDTTAILPALWEELR